MTLAENGTVGAPKFLPDDGDHEPDEKRMRILGVAPLREEKGAQGEAEAEADNPRPDELHPLPQEGDDRKLPEQVEKGLPAATTLSRVCLPRPIPQERQTVAGLDGPQRTRQLISVPESMIQLPTRKERKVDDSPRSSMRRQLRGEGTGLEGVKVRDLRGTPVQAGREGRETKNKTGEGGVRAGQEKE